MAAPTEGKNWSTAEGTRSQINPLAVELDPTRIQRFLSKNGRGHVWAAKIDNDNVLVVANTEGNPQRTVITTETFDNGFESMGSLDRDRPEAPSRGLKDLSQVIAKPFEINP